MPMSNLRLIAEGVLDCCFLLPASANLFPTNEQETVSAHRTRITNPRV